MKYLKIIGLAVMAAAALMAFAGSASATVLTSPSGTECTGTLTLTLVTAGSTKQEDGFATTTCTESTMSGKVETNTTAATGAISTLDFSTCNITTDILKSGAFEVKSGGEFLIRGNEVTDSTLGTSCVYGGGTGTKLGTLTGGTPATLTVEARLPKISGGSLCANPATWTGKYTVTAPSTLLVD